MISKNRNQHIKSLAGIPKVVFIRGTILLNRLFFLYFLINRATNTLNFSLSVLLWELLKASLGFIQSIRLEKVET